MIKAIKIKNFKSIKEAIIEIPKFSVLIGKNAAGKSNLISAIKLTTLLARGETISSALNSIAPFAAELFNDDIEEKVATIELIIEVEKDVRYKFCYSLKLDRSTENNEFVIGKELLYKFENERNIFILIYSRDNDQLHEIQNEREVSIPFKVESDKLVLSSYSREELIQITNELKSSVILDPTNIGKKDKHEIINGQKPDLNNIDGIVTALYIKSQEIFDQASAEIKNTIKDFIPPQVINLSKVAEVDESVASKKDEQTSYFVFWKAFNNKVMHSFMSNSGGNIRTAFLLYTLFYIPKNSFMIIEEIENGMHMGRIKKLIDEFKTQAINRNIQLIISTHSLEVLTSMISPPEVIYCYKDKIKGSIYQNLTDTDGYKAIKEELHDADPSIKDLFDSGFLNQ